MKTDDFDYELNPDLIAQHPLENRSHSKLLVLDKVTGEVTHRHFKDLLEYITPNDVLVLNDSKVIPARLYGHREGKEDRVEVLLLHRRHENEWECLVRPGKKLRENAKVVFGDGRLTGQITRVLDTGNRMIRFEYEGIFEEILDELGEMPLPPYIYEKLTDNNRYQTVYAKVEGSAAAPTAGLHFTNEMLEEIAARNISTAKVTLHVGLGTFRPVKVDDVQDHTMHSEYYEVGKEACETIRVARQRGGRVFAVGTTTARTLESAVNEDGELVEGSGWTDIFIYPGYQFRIVDSLITNFHLPKSTLMMLVSALASKERILSAYQEAIANNYRFFSFGDAMLITDTRRNRDI